MGVPLVVMYQFLPFALPDDIFSQNMTRIAPLFSMLEMRLHRSLVSHICSHITGLIVAAEQHARLPYSCPTLEGAVEDIMLVGQILGIFYCGRGPRFRWSREAIREC